MSIDKAQQAAPRPQNASQRGGQAAQDHWKPRQGQCAPTLHSGTQTPTNHVSAAPSTASGRARDSLTRHESRVQKNLVTEGFVLVFRQQRLALSTCRSRCPKLAELMGWSSSVEGSHDGVPNSTA
jgi:hypothetical protein